MDSLPFYQNYMICSSGSDWCVNIGSDNGLALTVQHLINHMHWGLMIQYGEEYISFWFG